MTAASVALQVHAEEQAVGRNTPDDAKKCIYFFALPPGRLGP